MSGINLTDDVDGIAESAWLRAYREGQPDYFCRLSAYAAVEKAVREQIARDIQEAAGLAEQTANPGPEAGAYIDGLDAAANIARGEP